MVFGNAEDGPKLFIRTPYPYGNKYRCKEFEVALNKERAKDLRDLMDLYLKGVR